MSTAKTRIYLVTVGSDVQRLVRAQNKTQARNHVARETINAEVAGQDDLVALAGAVPPVRVEDATVESE